MLNTKTTTQIYQLPVMKYLPIRDEKWTSNKSMVNFIDNLMKRTVDNYGQVDLVGELNKLRKKLSD